MAAKFGRVVTYDEGSSLVMSRNVVSLVTWKINLIPSLPQDLPMIMQLCRVVTYDQANSRDNVQTKYLLFYKACDHQTWQYGDL